MQYPWTRILLFFLLLPLLYAEDIQVHNNQTDETENDVFSMFTVLHNPLVPKYQSPNSHIVFKDGVVNDLWIEQTDDDASITDLYTDHAYSDRISFDFFYTKYHNYDIAIPTTTSNSTIAKPKVIHFHNEQNDQSGSFTVVYDCQTQTSPTIHNVTITLIFPIASGLSVLFQFRKQCSGGDHQHLQFGYYEESDNDAKEKSRSPFTTDKPIIGPHVMNTKLYLQLLHPATTQEFFHVKVTSSNPGLEVTPKGPIFGGVLTTAETAIVHILYDCNGRGRYDVAATIPINPFNSLQASWTKDCGGGVASGFNIGSQPWGKDDIVKSGVTSKFWSTTLQSTTTSSQVPVLNESVRAKEFWLSNDGFSLHVAPPVVTVEKPTVLTVIAPERYTRRSLLTSESSGLLPQGESVKCQLRLICKQKGTTLVIVTFPITSFTNVDVSFFKQCNAPRRYVHSGFLRTANSVMMFVSFCMVCLLAYLGKQQWAQGEASQTDKPAPGYRQI